MNNSNDFEEEKNQNNEVNNQNSENSNNDFSSEFEEQKKVLDKEKFANKQEEYRQMMADSNNIPSFSNDKYMWRIGFGRRFGAYLIDAIFFFIFLIIAMIFTGVLEEFMAFMPTDSTNFNWMTYMEEFSDFSARRVLPLTIAVSFVYYSLEIIFAQSLGKMLLGIVIGTDDRKFAPYKNLIIRFAIKNISLFFDLLLFFTAVSIFGTLGSFLSFVVFIGFFFVFGEKKQALHDTLAKTAIYYKDELSQFDNGKKESELKI
jgi:uncharacterized RDD family membrane protein YckC